MNCECCQKAGAVAKLDILVCNLCSYHRPGPRCKDLVHPQDKEKGHA